VSRGRPEGGQRESRERKVRGRGDQGQGKDQRNGDDKNRHLDLDVICGNDFSVFLHVVDTPVYLRYFFFWEAGFLETINSPP
jgi:hypothetical protein